MLGLSCSTQDLCCIMQDLSLRHLVLVVFFLFYLFNYLFILDMPHSLWDLSFLIRDETLALSTEILGVLTTGLLENSHDILHLKIITKEKDTQKEESKRESSDERELQKVLVDCARSFFLTTTINSQWKSCLLVNLCFKNENILLKQVGRMIKEWGHRGVYLPQNGFYPKLSLISSFYRWEPEWPKQTLVKCQGLRWDPCLWLHKYRPHNLDTCFKNVNSIIICYHNH